MMCNKKKTLILMCHVLLKKAGDASKLPKRVSEFMANFQKQFLILKNSVNKRTVFMGVLRIIYNSKANFDELVSLAYTPGMKISIERPKFDAKYLFILATSFFFLSSVHFKNIFSFKVQN